MRVALCSMILLLFFTFSCDDGGRTAYVYEIIDKGNGQCTYNLSFTKTGKNPDFTINSACGKFVIGEELEVPK
ncbi:MAG TPA: hypothetical protein VFE50_11155 [Cyclobacteriaceae bacterium]|nr:hypothetical protein [Cyclobacteriaceae bacterium]